MEISKQRLYLTVVDHSVTKDTFELYHNAELDLLQTHPKPKGDELIKYYESEDYISHTDSKRSFFEKMYHFIRNLALKNKLRLINSESNNVGRLLDIGAGTGEFLIAAQKAGWTCIGVEPSVKAKSIAMSKGVKFEDTTTKLEDNSFDVITMWHVLEHVPDPFAQMAELHRLLKPNGSIIIAVPNFKSYDAKYYKTFWAAFDVPRHLWHFSKTAIDSIAQQNGLKLIKILPMWFDSFYVSLLSEKYKTGKMNFLKAGAIGLLSNAKGIQNNEYSSHIYILKQGKLA